MSKQVAAAGWTWPHCAPFAFYNTVWFLACHESQQYCSELRRSVMSTVSQVKIPNKNYSPKFLMLM